MFSPHLVTGVQEKIDQFCTANFKKRIFNGQKCNLITGILFLVNAFMIEKKVLRSSQIRIIYVSTNAFQFRIKKLSNYASF